MKIRTSRVKSEDATLIAQLNQKRINTITKTTDTTAPTKIPHTYARNRGPAAEAAYATPVPREQKGPITADQNLHNWGAHRGLPIDKIKTLAAQLKTPQPMRRKTIRYIPPNAFRTTV